MNMNEWSMYLHVMGDAVGSAIVVGNACVIKYGSQWGESRLLADPITSLIMVLIIMVQTIPLIRDASLILMETAPAKISADIQDAESLERELLRIPGVLDIHELHTWSLNPSTFLCTLHVVVQTGSVRDVNKIVDRIKQLLHHNNIHSSTIQTEILSPCTQLCDHSDDVGCEVFTLQKKASSCADFVCDDSDCLTNSCCALPAEDRKSR